MSDVEAESGKNTLTIAGVLAGLTLTTMILIIENRNAFTPPSWLHLQHNDYTEFLISGMALVSIFFIISAAHYSIIATFGSRVSKSHRSVNDTVFLAGFAGLMVMIPVVVGSFSTIGMLVIVVIEIAINLFLVREIITFLRSS